ncbi:MAG: hypothetical protein HQ481_04135 [Alphaproteobacteria bacterium]|nr:hypothetical protein [Alphaproteobacteria bacterium]
MKDRFYRLPALLAVLVVISLSRPGYAESDFDYTGVFFKTFMTACMPAAHSRTPIDLPEFIKMPDQLAQLWLGGKPGAVWQVDATHEVLLVSPANFHCYVVSKLGDVDDLEQRVRKAFDPSVSEFTTDAFERADDGGFTASYSRDNADGTQRRVLIKARPPAEGRIQLVATAAITKSK